MTKATPSVQRVREILGKYSIASLRNWLKRVELPHTMNSRAEMVTKVHGLLESGDITEDGLIEASIGIEEASSKRTFLYRIPHEAKDLAKIDEQLDALEIPLSTERTPSVSPTMTPTLTYAINNESVFRAKWSEQHVRIKVDKRLKEFSEIKVAKIIVVVANKKTGEVQLRYDHPDDKHSHMIENEPSDQAYYDYYREKTENMLGLRLEPIDFRAGLEKILKTEPRIVTTNYTIDEAEDGALTKRTQKKDGKDIRDTEEWKHIAKGKMARTFEEAPLRWIPKMSNGSLTRELFSYVDAANGLVRFDADCYDGEIDYVLSQLVQSSTTPTPLT
jgi:hypothetical protein